MDKKQFVLENIDNELIRLTKIQKLFISQAFDGKIEKVKAKHYQIINRIAKRYSKIITKYKKNTTRFKIEDIFNIGISEGLRKYSNVNVIIDMIYDNYDFMTTEDYKGIVKCINNNIDLPPAIEYKVKIILEKNKGVD